MEIEQLDDNTGVSSHVQSNKKEIRRQRVMNTRSYKMISKATQWMDRYYIDPILGLVPGGWGDLVSAVMLLPFVWFSAFVVKSLPLTLAVIYNTLRDVVLGLIPFFVGDIIDVFHHSYIRNMRLIQGFVDNDRDVVHAVNRKAFAFAGAILLCIVIIVLLIKLTVSLLGHFFS
ncbi:MAG: DUF4112 domain-containing protein [Prevotella sp.]|jgi:hypothetical protein